MERYLLGLLVVMFLVVATHGVHSQQGTVAPGTKVLSRPNIQIAVRNLGGIGDMAYGDTCNTENLAELTAIGEDNGRVLVDYRAKQANYGCPNGTLGFVDGKIWKDLVQWSQDQRRKIEQLENDKNIVRDLLQKYKQK